MTPSLKTRTSIERVHMGAPAADTSYCENEGLRVRRKTLKPATPSVV